MFSILARLAPRQFFSRNFVTLVADFWPKLKTWSPQIMFYTRNLDLIEVISCWALRVSSCKNGSIKEQRDYFSIFVRNFRPIVSSNLTIWTLSVIWQKLHGWMLAWFLFFRRYLLLYCMVAPFKMPRWNWQKWPPHRFSKLLELIQVPF